MREDFRPFKLTPLREIEKTDQPFARTAPRRVFEKVEVFGEERVTPTLRFPSEYAFSVNEHFEWITEKPDGTLEVMVSLPHNEHLYPFLLSFGEKMEVLAPASVRESLRQKIHKMLKNYET